MITLYDYLPSQNAYKIRLLLAQLQQEYKTELVSIFEGEGQRPEFLAINPTGAVPAIRLEDGRVLAESNAILFYLAQGSQFLPQDSYEQARLWQWLSFEGDYVQATVATIRHWTMTGKLARRAESLVSAKRAGSLKVLRILDRELADRRFLVADTYTIADISLFAYVHLAEEGGLPLPDFPHVLRWIERVKSQDNYLGQVYPYSIDPYSIRELP
ncbi:glutathione S-transferase family protein [Undibacterium terreum]|uniref:Glutathione S-transferase n=1 Tax=Undibacterium terreum TaxID=1224302 RepID=A0A916U6V1_9BURK|nr:glutathione S-transferase family protein [Undibacterium terreum]GGC60815.1 glutathione S-transferase [Undibacterium terreum]